MDRLTRRSALGRQHALGTFYNARNDSFLTANFLAPTFSNDGIQVSDIQSQTVDLKLDPDETWEKKFETLGIDAELGASVLTGLTPLKGSGAYLTEKPRGRAVYAALHHIIHTITESLNLGFAGLKDSLATDEISNGEITHVVAAIEWGARSIISARQPLGQSSREEKSSVKIQFQSDAKSFLSAVQTLPEVEKSEVNWQNAQQPPNPTDITVFSDILDNGGIIVQDFQEAYEFLQLIPLCIKDENSGKGLPMVYSLLPIEVLALVVPSLKFSCFGRLMPLPADCLDSLNHLFNELQTCERTLDGLELNVLANRRYLSPNLLQLIRNRQKKLTTVSETMKLNLSRTLAAVREGTNPVDLLRLLAEYQEGESSPADLSNIYVPLRKTIEFISRATSLGATYVGHNGLSLDEVLPIETDSEAYVLFFSPSLAKDDNAWSENRDLIYELLQNRDSKTVIAIVDCEVVSASDENIRIAHYEGGVESTGDYLEYKSFIANKCLASCDEQTIEGDAKPPIQRRHVIIPCPGHKCTVAEIREWICPRCEAALEYGFSDQYIYCDCGRSLYSNFKFKCSSSSHGPAFARYDPDQLLCLLQGLSQANYLNILILGETGVGKSTFINALVNYLEFESLDDAIEAEKLNYVIPCSFSTQIMDRVNPDRPIEEKQIKIGARDDEKDGSKGDSATQQTTVYPVKFTTADSTLTVRLIDTPGMGDTRGVDADRKNMADVLSTLSGYDELHGILILLKSNASRLTISFSYCIKELLTHLHHNAAQNMAFGFTNTRISNYTPGDTYGPLKALLIQHPDIGLGLSTPTTYCFDSESFRYLAASKSGVEMENKLDFDRSWEHSRRESLRLINHFQGNPPHKIKNTLSLNGARQVILELTKPMAEISQVIQANISLTESKLQELKDTRLTGDQLRSRLHVEKVQMNAIPLERPRTVCANGSCIEVRDDGKDQNKTITVYKAICHRNCSRTDVQVDQLAHPGLINCCAFGGQATCRRCGHNWQEHLHVLYELTEETVTAIDNTIQTKLRSHANDVTLRETALIQHEQRLTEYKQEREILRDAAAEFGVFLRNNSLAPYNDALIAYLDYLIKEEQIKVQAGGGDERLTSLNEERSRHTEAIKVIMRDTSIKARSDMGEGEIDRMVQRLYGLKHFGTMLNNMKQGIATAHQATYREIPYTVRGNRKATRKYSQKFQATLSNTGSQPPGPKDGSGNQLPVAHSQQGRANGPERSPKEQEPKNGIFSWFTRR